MKMIRSCIVVMGALLIYTACTDYVGQIDEQIDAFNVCARAREESSIPPADYPVDPSTVIEGSFTDPRDDKVYRMVTIGSQTWMAENLNYEVEGSYCYNDADSNCAKYGRLYTWSLAMDSAGRVDQNAWGCGMGKVCAPSYPVRGVCPKGWHLPSSGDWGALLAAFNGYYGSCGTEKSGDCTFNTEDSYGFTVLFAGARSDVGEYYSEGSIAFFWHATENSNDRAIMYGIMSDRGGYVGAVEQKNYALSVRCVKNEPVTKPEESSIDESSSSVGLKPRSSSSVKSSSSSEE